MNHIPISRLGGERRSRDGHELIGVDGTRLAWVSESPPLLVSRVLQEMRGAPTQTSEARMSALVEAGRLFAEAVLEGETPEDYQRLHALSTGVPISVSRSALQMMAAQLERLRNLVDVQRPVGAVPSAVVGGGAVGSGGARWATRARLLGVLAPSNHPMTHIGWLQALALGYRVAVRPGSRDPFTPRRLARALREAGLTEGWLAVLPGTHLAAEALMSDADLGLVYGDEASVARYRGQSKFLVRGPGRTKALVWNPEKLSESSYDYLVECIAGDGGVRCTNVSAVFVNGDHIAVTEALARRLGQLPAHHVLDYRSALPARSGAAAADLRRAVASVGDGAVDVTQALGVPPVTQLDGGLTVLRPAVLRVDRGDHPALRVELPFPCVCVAPWRPEDGIAPLTDSLAVHLVGDADRVVDELLDEPSIRTVVSGEPSVSWSDPLLPHDGYLSHFLMEARGHLVPEVTAVSGSG